MKEISGAWTCSRAPYFSSGRGGLKGLGVFASGYASLCTFDIIVVYLCCTSFEKIKLFMKATLFYNLSICCAHLRVNWLATVEVSLGDPINEPWTEDYSGLRYHMLLSF